MSTSIYGIDVSKHNGAVNWQQVKQAGKEFAFIRLGWAGYDGRIEANGGLDSLFHRNMQAAIAAGMHVGVYVYSYAKSAAAAIVAARETLELVKPYQLDYPIAWDIEDQQYIHMDKALVTQIADAYLAHIEQAGYYGLLYTYKNFAEPYLNMTALARYDVWIAQYAAKCTYTGKYGIWQYAGEAGRCPGVTGSCDLNISYKDYAKLIQDAGLNGLGKAQPPVVDDVPADTVPAAEFEALAGLYDVLLDDHQRLQVDYDTLALLHDAAVADADKLRAIREEIQALVERYKV